MPGNKAKARQKQLHKERDNRENWKKQCRNRVRTWIPDEPQRDPLLDMMMSIFSMRNISRKHSDANALPEGYIDVELNKE